MTILLHFCFNLCFGSVSPMTDVKTEDKPWILCHFHPTTAVATTPLRPLYTSNLNPSPHTFMQALGQAFAQLPVIFSSHSTVLCTIITQIWYPVIITFSRGCNFLYPKNCVLYITNYFLLCRLWNLPPKARSHMVYASIQPCGLKCSLARQELDRLWISSSSKETFNVKKIFFINSLPC